MAAKELSPSAAPMTAAEDEKARLKEEKKKFKQEQKAQKKEAKKRGSNADLISIRERQRSQSRRRP